MPLHIPNAYVAEDYSEPMLQPDGSAFVEVTTYINGAKAGVRAEALTRAEVQAVLDAPPQGASVRQAIGVGVLGYLAQAGRTRGAQFPGDYVDTVHAPAEEG